MRFTHRSLKVMVVMAVMAGLALLISGCSPKDDGATVLRMGSQGYTESEILGEMIKALIEDRTDFKVEHIKNLGSSLGALEATTRGDLDLSSNFSGSLFLGTFDQTLTDEYRDPQKVYDYVKEAMLEHYNIHVVANYGYNNVYAIAVPRAWAEAHNVTKQSEMAAYAPDMVLAVRSSWKTYPGQGYPEYVELYGYEYKETPEMEFGLMYKAIDTGDVDAICAYSTDGQLVAQDLFVLEDDKGFNPPYNGILLASDEVLTAHPELREILETFDHIVDTEQIQKLNMRVAVEEEEPSAVAREYLQQKGLID